jgi:hypothetical protein
MTDSSPDGVRSKAILLKTATPDFLEFIGNGKRYAVPPYQRHYSWDEENWDGLWNDILALVIIKKINDLAQSGIDADAHRQRSAAL